MKFSTCPQIACELASAGVSAGNENGFSLESRAVTQAGYPREKPLRLEAMTGLRRGQLTELAARVAAATGDVVKPGGSPAVTGLYKSVAMVVTFMRTNITQEMAGDISG